VALGRDPARTWVSGYVGPFKPFALQVLYGGRRWKGGRRGGIYRVPGDGRLRIITKPSCSKGCGVPRVPGLFQGQRRVILALAVDAFGLNPVSRTPFEELLAVRKAPAGKSKEEEKTKKK